MTTRWWRVSAISRRCRPLSEQSWPGPDNTSALTLSPTPIDVLLVYYDEEPDPPHGHLVGMAGGSLAERQDTYQRPGQRHRARGQHALPDQVGQRGRGPEGVGR